MSDHGTITQWITKLKAGEESALEKIRERYWPLLVRLARARLASVPRLVQDDEDVVQETFWRFYRSLKNGRVPRLENRHQLLTVLTFIMARRAASHIEKELRAKRDARRVRGESALAALASSISMAPGVEGVEDSAAGAEEQVLAKDAYDFYVNALSDEVRPFAVLWLAGHSSREIAAIQKCAVRTVERKIKIAKDDWQKLAETDASDIKS